MKLIFGIQTYNVIVQACYFAYLGLMNAYNTLPRLLNLNRNGKIEQLNSEIVSFPNCLK